MKIEELNQKLLTLKKEYELKQNILYKEYCFSNNPYNVGDVIKDNIGSIKITLIQYMKGSYINSNKPECVYTGYELKKDGTIRKDQSIRKIYQSEII